MSSADLCMQPAAVSACRGLQWARTGRGKVKGRSVLTRVAELEISGRAAAALIELRFTGGKAIQIEKDFCHFLLVNLCPLTFDCFFTQFCHHFHVIFLFWSVLPNLFLVSSPQEWVVAPVHYCTTYYQHRKHKCICLII